MSRIAIVTDAAVGGTFVAWSLQWLSGQENYFSTKHSAYVDVIPNPVGNQNSHRFLANHATTIESIERYLKMLPNNTVEHLYFHQLKNQGRYSHDKVIANTKAGIDLAVKECDRIIVVKKSPQYQLYHCSLESRSNIHVRLSDGSAYYSTDQNQVLDEYINFFFKDSLDTWQSLNLNEVWDKREFLALNLRPFDWTYIDQCHDMNFDYYDLSADTCWLALDRCIRNILEYCDIKIDESRFDHWQSVYAQWQTLHQDRIRFCKSFDSIVDAILNGSSIDLAEFNLDLVREAAIQHQLIYKYNLNLKTWQLTKFINTKQLHNLLEPNIHPLIL